MAGYEKHRPEGRKLYLSDISVLQAAEARIRWAFGRFAHVVVCVSGGKDSTVLFRLALREARSRGREIHAFFLDQEAEYASTIELQRSQLAEDGVTPHWYQVPLRMTNATSYTDEYLYAWEPGAAWLRDKEPGTIHALPAGAPDRFYPFMEWFESQWGADTCLLIGLRSEESLNRFGAVTRHPAIPGINWSSKTTSAAVKLYPIYDWAFEDVWTYLGKFRVPYNRVYDWLWVKGKHIPEFRVSNLIHEKAYRCLATLQEFEPDTYERLTRRLTGVHTAALYGAEQTVYQTGRLPPRFQTWRAYRDFLLDTYAGADVYREQFRARFADQPESEGVFRQQVRQLLLNDWENNVPVKPDDPDTRAALKRKWMELL